jgi:uncharacterized membrane protein (DUF441 family)
MLEVIVDFVKTSRKAIVAFVLTTAFSWLAKKGLSLDVESQEAIRVLLEALVVSVAVWLVPNKK